MRRLKVARAVALGGLATVVFASETALAQDPDSEPDPTARYDIDDVLGRHPHDVSELPDDEEARGRHLGFELGLAGTYATNAGTSRFNSIDAGYVTPSLGVDVFPVSLGGWEVGGGVVIDADFYGGGHDDAFGEGRLEGFAFASHELGPGSFTAEGIVLGIFSNDFSEQELNLYIGNLTYSMATHGVNLEGTVEYQDSDIPELRRARLVGRLGHTIGEPILGYSVTVEGDLAVSDFTGGANADRRDATTGLVLMAEREVARGWSLEWEVAVIRRFSNRSESEFSALDLGVELSRSF